MGWLSYGGHPVARRGPCPPLGTLWSTQPHRHARPVRGSDHHPDGDPQRHPPGQTIGPAAPSAGGEAAPEAEAQKVGEGRNREDFTRISRSALRAD